MKMRRRSKLRTRMMLSYVAVSVAAVLSLETLLALIVFFVIVLSPALDGVELANAKRIAHAYAQSIDTQVEAGTPLDAQKIFASSASSPALTEGESNSFDAMSTVPYIPSTYSGPQPAPFALILARDGSVLASSYPAHYPTHVDAIHLLPTHASLIMRALHGDEGESINWTMSGRVGTVVVPIFNKNRQVRGAVYVQLPPEVSINGYFSGFVTGFLFTGLITLLLAAPTGALFGLITTRGLVRRVEHLADATAQFANGHYEQRVPVKSEDEVGQLERQFNLMAEQLVESIEQRQSLTEQNARLAERARISRDLHDSVKQQAFALTMQVSTALTMFDTQPEAARTHLQESEMLAHQVQQELGQLIQSLRPSPLSERGLAPVLQDYLAQWSRQQKIVVHQHIDICELPAGLAEALLRITQEALSNVARHSNASRVTLDLSCTQEVITFLLEDNGDGFDLPSVIGKGVGLQSMRERIDALDGTFHIESKTGQGTRIEVHCPHSVCTKNMPVGVLQ